MSKEYRAFIEQQRKMHEQIVREQKDFVTLVNRVKTNNKQGSNMIEEVIRDC